MPSAYDESPVALYGQMPSVTAMAYSGGRLFYTRAGTKNLYWRWFSTDSGVIGSQEFTANAGKSWSGTAGMFATKARLYYVTGKGALRSIALKKGLPSGSTALVNSRIDWRANALFLGPKTAVSNGTPTPTPPPPPPWPSPPRPSPATSCYSRSASTPGPR